MTIKSYVVCGDQHIPFHDIKLHHAFCEFLHDFKPDGFVINGDFMDLYSINYFIKGVNDLVDTDGYMFRLKKEFQRGNDVLDDYDKMLPKNCEKHFLFGN